MMVSRIAIFLLFSSCVRQTSITLKVHVKTPEGEDINGAHVSMDGEEVGETNAFGTFTYEFKADKESLHKVEIAKESEHYYFAPFAASKKLPKIARYEWAVDSTLYMVPKPRPTKSNLAADITVDEQSASADAILPGNIASGSRDAGILNGFPFLEEGLNLRSEMDLTLSSAERKSADTSQLDEAPLFTVHTSVGSELLANTEVYGCFAGKAPELLCKSNDRGRCVVRHATAGDLASWSLIVKHPTSKTQIVTGPFERNANLRVSMVAGRSEDYVFLYDDIGSSPPAANVSVAVTGDPAVLISSACGLVSMTPKSVTGDARHIRVTHAALDGSVKELDMTLKATPFQEVRLKPAKKSMPRFVLEPLLPGPNLTDEDFKRWFEVSLLRRITDDLKNLVKRSGVEAVSLEKFQGRETAVVERTVKSWSHSSNALAMASHRVRSVLYRSPNTQSSALSLSFLVLDANGKSLFSAQKEILTTNDVVVAENAFIQSFTAALEKDLPLEKGGQIDPVGNWLVIASTGEAKPPLVVDGSHTVRLKAPEGHLDKLIKTASDAVMTVVYEPITFEENIVEKLYSEASHMNAGQLLKLVLDMKKDFIQRRELDLIAAYLESLVPESDRAHLTALIQAKESGLKEINRGIALVMMSVRESEAKEERIKNASEAIAIFDAALNHREKIIADSLTAFQRRVVLLNRGQAKSVVSGLKDDAMLSMDAEADIREVMKTNGDNSKMSSEEQRLRAAATKTLKSLETPAQ